MKNHSKPAPAVLARFTRFLATKPCLLLTGERRAHRAACYLDGRRILHPHGRYETLIAVALGYQNPECLTKEKDEDFLRLNSGVPARLSHRLTIMRIRLDFEAAFQDVLGPKCGFLILGKEYGRYIIHPGICVLFRPDILLLPDDIIGVRLKELIRAILERRVPV